MNNYKNNSINSETNSKNIFSRSFSKFRKQESPNSNINETTVVTNLAVLFLKIHN